MRYSISILLIIIAVCAWSPWLLPSEAQDILDAKIAQVKNDYPKLCEISNNRNSLKKVVFGYTEEVSYDCTVTDPVYGVVKSRDFVLVTFYKGILRMPIHTTR